MNEKLIPALTAFKGLSIDELRELNSLLVDTIKRLRDAEGASIASQLFVGCLVKINHDKCAGQRFIITEMKQKKAIVKQLDSNGKATNKGFNVSFSLISPI